jgi:hypothetical protein
LEQAARDRRDYRAQTNSTWSPSWFDPITVNDMADDKDEGRFEGYTAFTNHTSAWLYDKWKYTTQCANDVIWYRAKQTDTYWEAKANNFTKSQNAQNAPKLFLN